MDHLRAWPVMLPECVKKVDVSLSRRKERDPLSPHHGTRYVPSKVHTKEEEEISVNQNTVYRVLRLPDILL